jgi:hypothetical protein
MPNGGNQQNKKSKMKNLNKIFGNLVNSAKQQISMEKQTNTLDKQMEMTDRLLHI